ncbi:hypothetical protein [Nocardia amamiensis]|uniref:hypothetical protein n=1 Tax=Nocardia amamiensis TaxID=404578 RepID=UPI000834651B|nr:hypothetical protein [Nocardia amamiensis]
MPDFSADLNQLVKSARSWEYASKDLKEGAAKAQSIQDSNKEIVWALFQDAWDANLKAAQYMYDRMNEGGKESESMGDVLQHVAKVLMEQDQNFANVLLKLDSDGN